MTKITEKEPTVQLVLAESEAGLILAALMLARRQSSTAIAIPVIDSVVDKLKSALREKDSDFDATFKKIYG